MSDPGRAPILVTGINRSGTTWVGRTLAHAPGLGMIYEPFNPGHRRGTFRAEVPHWFTYANGTPPPGLATDLRRTLEFRYSYAAEIRRLRSVRDAGRMGRDAARFAAHRIRGARPLMKDPIAVLAAPWLAREFGMQVVVMIRHPGAYAASLRRLNWTHDFSHFLDQPGLVDELVPELRADIAEFARRPPHVVDQAALLWDIVYTVVDRYRAVHPDWTYVRHEDLATSPAAGFEAMCDRLGIEYSAGVARFVAETTSASNPAEAGEGVVHALHRHSAASVRTWHERLTPEEIGRVRARTGRTAAAFYPESDWVRPGPV
ncbi:MAG TPA: sulfotransferase [Gaiellales bacterium]|nr:sulfotransferase [Gaiellales bacterium]